jgi:erythromycin esterase
MFFSLYVDPMPRLESIDPDAPFDDLEPYAETFRAARVVGIGETAHHIREYALLRHRLTRFLVERCGYTVFAFESAFAEGAVVEEWLRGGPGDVAAVAHHGMTYGMGDYRAMAQQLAWLREAGQVHYSGIDVPGANGLSALTTYTKIKSVAKDDAGWIAERLIELAQRFEHEHALPAYDLYRALPKADRDEITALLADLLTYWDAAGLDPVLRHEIRLAVLQDQVLRGYGARLNGERVSPMTSPRDLAMAESVRWLLERHGPGARVIVGAANGHLQRTPVTMGPGFSLSGAGHFLAQWFGDDYLSIAVTALGGRTLTRAPNSELPSRVETPEVPLWPPVEGSVEATLDGLSIVDLRPRRGSAGQPVKIRVLDIHQDGPVADGHDFVISIPRISVDEPLER